jgi:hypothetical protein
LRLKPKPYFTFELAEQGLSPLSFNHFVPRAEAGGKFGHSAGQLGLTPIIICHFFPELKARGKVKLEAILPNSSPNADAKDPSP